VPATHVTPWVVADPVGCDEAGHLLVSLYVAEWAMPFLLLGMEPPTERNGGWMNPGCVA
jgi:hypothetical protein